ncbi:uncharacterized protein METZ01_LOCUS454758 [marine metagenome]|uniref:Uncharacterized protein n=1 Tax=marine metagenome TaxID=408172 RepID=A0A383A2G6_9ZZZZ
MAEICPVCNEKTVVDECFSVEGVEGDVEVHTYCLDKFNQNPEKYGGKVEIIEKTEAQIKAERICAVCDKNIGILNLHKIRGVVIHEHCLEEFMKHPETYEGKKLPTSYYEFDPLGDLKSLPAKKKPPRPSLTSYIAKKTGESLKEKAIQSVVMAKNAAKTSKSIFQEADRRVGKIEDIETEEDAYEFAAKEVEEESYKKGLWAKAFSDAQGDEKKQAALYIKYRANQLIQFLDELA